MSTKVQKKISECTNAELHKFASTVLGLTLPPTANKAALIGSISTVWQHDFIEIVLTQSANHPPIMQNPPARADDGEEYVTVVIHKNDDIAGQEPVWLCVNGRGLWVPRGVPARIRRRYEHVLKNAVRSVGEQMYMNGIPSEVAFRDVQSYPYHIVADVPTPQALQAAA